MPVFGTSQNLKVLFGLVIDRFGEILADFVLVDIDRGGEFDVARYDSRRD